MGQPAAQVQPVCPLSQSEGQSRAEDGSKRLRRAGGVCSERTRLGVGQYLLCADLYHFSAHQQMLLALFKFPGFSVERGLKGLGI